MNLGVVVRKEQLLQKGRLGDQDDANDEENDDEEPAIGNKFRRTPLLRLSPVSTFLRLDKLGCFGFGIFLSLKGVCGACPPVRA